MVAPIHTPNYSKLLAAIRAMDDIEKLDDRALLDKVWEQCEDSLYLWELIKRYEKAKGLAPSDEEMIGGNP